MTYTVGQRGQCIPLNEQESASLKGTVSLFVCISHESMKLITFHRIELTPPLEHSNSGTVLLIGPNEGLPSSLFKIKY